MRLHLDFGLFKETYRGFGADKVPRLAAALSFTTIFAIAPLFIIVIAIAGFALGAANATGQGHSLVEAKLLSAIRQSAGTGAADAVRDMVTASFNRPRQSVIAQV